MEELFEDEFELAFELELEELFDDELELELLDELEELLPATMILPSVWPPACLPWVCAGAALSFACACVPAKAATPAIRAALNFQWFFMPVTPC
ncbi:hypothetical protein [Ensifer canadensis]